MAYSPRAKYEEHELAHVSKLSIASRVGVLALALTSLAESPALAVLRSSSTLPKLLACSAKVELKPSSYVISCADANSYLKGIHWTTWSATTAQGRATLWLNDCTPYCAAGRFHGYLATVTLSAPKSTKLARLFSQITVRYSLRASKVSYLRQSLPLRALG